MKSFIVIAAIAVVLVCVAWTAQAKLHVIGVNMVDPANIAHLKTDYYPLSDANRQFEIEAVLIDCPTRMIYGEEYTDCELTLSGRMSDKEVNQEMKRMWAEIEELRRQDATESE